MTDQKPSKKDFVDLINSVMGREIMNENQLSRFLDEATKVKDTRGTQGLLEYIQRVTNAPASTDQLKRMAETIEKTGSVGSALDFLKNEKLLTDQHTNQINKALSKQKRKKRKK